MDEILKLLASEPQKAIDQLKLQQKSSDKITSYKKEYKEFDRSQREGQIEKIQISKTLEGGKIAQMVKIYTNYAQKIVTTVSAFVVGKPVTLIPSEESDLSKLLKQVWRVNRIDSKLLEATILKLSETQCAIQFYINKTTEASLLNKVLLALGLKNQVMEIKAKVLDNTKGTMSPYFDGAGNMIFFMWEYETIINGKTIANAQIWDDKNVYQLSNANGKMEATKLPHGFDRIPIAYDEQSEPEWYTVKTVIDRYELAMSKLGDANDYSGHPILVTEGVVKNLPTKEESGKHFNIPIEFDENGKEIKGSVSFLESTTAPDANKLELDKLEEIISYGSSVPNLSLEKLKSIGNVAEKTVKLMFLDIEIKAELKRSETRTFIERCINILQSGITQTTNTALAPLGKKLYYDIQFNSILPSDLKEMVDTLYVATGNSKIMSTATAIKMLDVVDDVEAEKLLIDGENAVAEVVPTTGN